MFDTNGMRIREARAFRQTFIVSHAESGLGDNHSALVEEYLKLLEQLYP